MYVLNNENLFPVFSWAIIPLIIALIAHTAACDTLGEWLYKPNLTGYDWKTIGNPDSRGLIACRSADVTCSRQLQLSAWTVAGRYECGHCEPSSIRI